MPEHRSFCRLCLSSCGVVATTDDDGRLLSVRGDAKHPVTAGYACLTGINAPDAHNSPERLLHPLKRMPDGSFAPIALEQALDEIAAELARIRDAHGADAIGAFRGTANYSNVAAATLLPAWLGALGSPAFYSTMTVDQSAKWVTVERLGRWHAGRDNFRDSDVIMLVGGNPLVSGTVLGFPCSNPLKQIKDAKARGMTLIVIDPRRSETARFADIFVQPLPGEDVSVAAGLLRIVLANGWEDRDFCARHVNGLAALRTAVEPFTPAMVEARAGVPAATLQAAAEAFARNARRGFAVTGTGPDMGPFSNLAEHLYECLNVICGRFRRAGDRVANPMLQSPRGAWRAEVVPPARSWERGHRSRIRDTGMILGQMMSCVMVDEMLQPGPGQLRAMLVVGGNPVSVLPDPDKSIRAFRGLELLVTIDPVMTSTARLSHYIIPPKLQYERPDCLGLHDLIPEPLVQFTPAIATPPAGAEVVDEWTVFWELARRLGLPLSLNGETLDTRGPRPDTDAILDTLLRNAQLPLDEIRAATGGRLVADAEQRVEPGREDGTARFEVMPDDVRAEITAAFATPLAMDGFTHRLAVRRMRGVVNTAYHDLPGVKRWHPSNPAFLHPDDLRGLGLAAGDGVEIESAHGHVRATVQADAALRPGVLSMTHGWGDVLAPDASEQGVSTSFLLSADEHLETINSMVRLTGVPVRVSRANRG